MPKRFLTYHAREGDPKTTKSADVVFDDGVEVELPEGRDWLWWKLQANPWFSSRVEDAGEVLQNPEVKPADQSIH